jgi:hypothetical protein
MAWPSQIVCALQNAVLRTHVRHRAMRTPMEMSDKDKRRRW